MEDHERHFYLYAKNWYEITDHISDLKKITAHYTGLEEDHIHIEDIMTILSGMMDKHTQYISPSRFVDRLLEQKRWNPTYEINELLIVTMLSILRFTNVKDIAIDLGTPDASVLPLNPDADLTNITKKREE